MLCQRPRDVIIQSVPETIMSLSQLGAVPWVETAIFHRWLNAVPHVGKLLHQNTHFRSQSHQQNPSCCKAAEVFVEPYDTEHKPKSKLRHRSYERSKSGHHLRNGKVHISLGNWCHDHHLLADRNKDNDFYKPDGGSIKVLPLIEIVLQVTWIDRSTVEKLLNLVQWLAVTVYHKPGE